MANTVTRASDRLSISETFSFFGSSRLAGTIHAPLGVRRGAALICPSIAIDFVRNYRTEVVLARELAARGLVVQRFHYRGTGHSDGDPSQLSFEQMCEDAAEAFAHLASQDVDRVAIVGTRIGALVAAVVAASTATSPIVVIDPILDGGRFLKEGFRARMMRNVARGDEGPAARTTLKAELETTGSIDLLGVRLHRDLVHSLESQRFTELLGSDPRPMLVVQLGASELRADLRTLVADRQSSGLPIDTLLLERGVAWWFVDDDEQSLDSWLNGVVDWVSNLWGEER